MTPIVSVIIPTHRRAELLRRAIASVLNQSLAALELIVVENGQSSEGKEVVQEFQRTDGRIRYFYRPEPDPSLARNVGVQATHGQYIAFLDDDDEWLPTKLERQLAVFKESPHVGLVACGANRIKDSGEVVEEWPDFEGMTAFIYLATIESCIRSLSGVMIRRQCLETVGLFDRNYFIANDFELYLRLAKRYKFILLREPLYRYTQHEGNMCKNALRL